MNINKKEKISSDIDFVITWVDGNDKNWKIDKLKYDEKKDINKNNVRYRDWDNLRYWFRGVEEFAPWVHKIYFVTYGHVPKWLNLNHPKLVIINHKDYIPNEFLPTFSSHPIELQMHNIQGLSEKFVYFNDDMFILKDVKPSDFFYKELPCDSAILNAQISVKEEISSIVNNNMGIINTYFNKSEQLSKNKFKYFNMKYRIYNLRTMCLIPWRHFTGFFDPHLPISFLKSTFNQIWDKEENLLNEISSNKFRTKNDVNVWMFRYWQLASGKFHPRSLKIGKYFDVGDNNDEVINTITSQKYKMVCINDNGNIKDFYMQKEILIKAFEEILPKKSDFEF